MNINKTIVDNLEHYINTSNPEYAFLISGEWGVGKTYFIDSFIKSKKDIKIIKVSLFGLKDTSSIDEKIFQELHPVLSSKTAKITSNFIKGAFKFGLKLDLDSDKKTETTFNIDLAKTNIIYDMLNGKQEEIIITFDDLERTNIEINEILGFINHLVEVQRIKVIIIANEDMLIKKTECGDHYKIFKERVIGKTFTVKHDFNLIINDFLKSIEHEKLKLKVDIIKDVYTISKYKNIRKIKQTISDFTYITGLIDDKYLENQEFYTLLVKIYFALSLEVKKGILSEDELNKNEPFKKNSNHVLYNKYFQNSNQLYNGKVWANMIFKGELDNINEETSKLVYFMKEKEKHTPDWVRLWNFPELENNEFSILISKLESEFKSLKETDLRILLHKISILIYFSKTNLSSLKLIHIKKISKKYIEKYIKSDLWLSIKTNEHSTYDGTGYSYLGGDDDDFKKIRSLILNKKKIEEQKINIVKSNNDLSLILKWLEDNDINSICNMLSTKYKIEDFFSKLDPSLFVKTLLITKNTTINQFNQLIQERYSKNHIYNNKPIYEYLTSEHDFWEDVNLELNNVPSEKNNLKYHLLKTISQYTITDVISSLNHEN